MFDLYTSNTAATKSATVCITGVAVKTKKLTVELQGSDTLANSPSTGTVPSYILIPAGSKGIASDGIAGWVEGSGDLFGINRDKYPTWKPISIPANSKRLSYELIFDACAASAQRYKGQKKDMVCLLNPETFAKVLAQDELQRRYIDKDMKRTVGATSIMVQSPSGMVEFISYKYEFLSTATIFVKAALERVGVTDLTMTPDGDGKFLHRLDRTAGKEARTYSNQALFTVSPACVIQITGINNAAAAAV